MADEGTQGERQNEDEIRAPEAPEGNAEPSQDALRAAIIGRVGLAGAREAPTPPERDRSPNHERNTDDTPDDDPDGQTKNVDSTDDKEQSGSNDAAHESLLARLHPGDIDASGHVAEPEMPRSAPSPDQKENPAKNIFGRIGHPGARPGAHELESPNPRSDSTDEKKEEGSRKETEWHEEELRRDPAKTIVAPDAAKTKDQLEGKKQ